MQFQYHYNAGDFDRLQERTGLKAARAATAAVVDATQQAVTAGRQSILSGGLPSSFANKLVGNVYPRNGVSAHPVGWINHKINYASVFETGTTIHGSPLLWIPLDSVPLAAGDKRLTPGQYVSRIGPLVSVNVPGKPPMLFGRGTRSTIARATKTKVRFRRGALAKGVFGESVPLYIGVNAVTEPHKFNIHGAVREAMLELPELYLRYFSAQD